MSRMGDEFILELAASLEAGLNKTAAKKKEDKEEEKEDKEEKCPECKCDPCECEKEEKKDKKKKKDDKKDATLYIVHGLSKLASELDEMGAEEASSLVDDALKVIVQKIQDQKE